MKVLIEVDRSRPDPEGFHGQGGVEQFHLKGTADDHNQDDHAGGGGKAKPIDVDLSEARTRFGEGREIKTSRKLAKVVATPSDPIIDRYIADGEEIGGYKDLNGSLRGKAPLPGSDPEVVADAVDGLTDLIDNAKPISDDLIVYRGIGLPMKDLAVGSLVTDPAFMSVSSDEMSAEVFASMGDKGVVVQIMVPEGSKGIVGDKVEGEVILQRGSSLRILSVTVPKKNPRFVQYPRIEAILEQA